MGRTRIMFQFKNWRIKRSDMKNLVLEKKVRIKDGDTGEMKDHWQFSGFYSTFHNAVNGMADKIGFVSGDLAEAVQEIREMRNTIERLMKGRS